jgi:hypothetical protein
VPVEIRAAHLPNTKQRLTCAVVLYFKAATWSDQASRLDGGDE